ncbi:MULTISPECIES: MFS transporter [Rhodococcus]|uniref:MFS transporter n=1 Tax=Rhodococcus globerulus TaxID=33008 RepID=UPI001C596AD5|nr:MFS transporter [Rhodococcus globerulus]QXV99915.1 MFS transporter [Rhodococcus globerulus]
MDVLTAIKTKPMKRFQYVSLMACLLVITVDGFDVFVMGFVLPHLPDDFFSGTAEKGYLLSAGLFGMAAGSILLAPLADRIGRRKLVQICLTASFVGMVASAMSPNVEALIVARLITGIGIGGMAASLVVLVQEYCSDSRRNLMVGIYSIGFPVGSLVGGGIGTLLVGSLGGSWHVMFAFGAVITLVAIAVAYAFMPESIDFLVTRNTPQAQAEINRIVARLDDPSIDPDARPVATPALVAEGSLRSLFSGRLARRTLLSWIAYASLMCSFYFANTWTPELVKTASGDANLGTTAGLILSLGGLFGALTFSLWTLKTSAPRVLWISMLGAAISIFTFAAFFTHSAVAIAITAAVGLFTYVAITASAAVVPQLYPASSRATAMGWMLGVGRLCSISAPIFVGYALAVVAPQTLYYFAAIPMLIGAWATHALWRLSRRPELESIDIEENAASAAH